MKEQKLVLLTAAAALMALAGCNDSRTNSSTNSVAPTVSSTQGQTNGIDGIRVAYGVVSDNLIRAEVQVKNKVVNSVRFDEVKFGASTIGETSAEAGDNVVTFGTGDKAVNYAKYLKVGDKLFTASVGDAFAYKNGDTDLDAYYKDASRTQAELSDFYYNLVNNFVYGADSTGARIQGEIATIVSKASKDSTYWDYIKDGKAVEGSQWKWNIQKIENALKGKDLSKAVKTDQGDDKVWTLDSVATGATIGSFDTYIELAAKAFKGESKIIAYYGADKLDGRKSNGHYNCISKVELVVGSDNKVIDTHINETTRFLEHWGTAKEDSAFPTVLKTTTSTASDGTTTEKKAYYAQYMSVNGTVWTATVNNDTSKNKQNVIYSSSLSQDALDYYGNDPYRAADYYNAAFSHHVNISSDDKGTNLINPTLGNVTATKAEYDCTYWLTGHGAPEDVKPADANNWWQWNIRAVENAFAGKDFSKEIEVEPAEAADADGHKYITFGGVKTGATMTEFATFVEFARRAYGYLI